MSWSDERALSPRGEPSILPAPWPFEHFYLRFDLSTLGAFLLLTTVAHAQAPAPAASADRVVYDANF